MMKLLSSESKNVKNSEQRFQVCDLLMKPNPRLQGLQGRDRL